jgi:hypothetical protein
MKVELGPLACAGINRHLGGDARSAVEKAVFLYASRLKAGRPVPELPRFLNGTVTSEPQLVLDLDFDAETEEQLLFEAANQGGSVEQLVSHAVLIYLAELDFLEAPSND